MLKLSTAPHLNAPTTTKGIMLDVIIALIPALIVSLVVFGIGALQVIITSVAGCVLFEYIICRYFLKTPPTTGDLSAVITGLLLAFNLPSGFPIFLTLLGCFVSSVIAKLALGSIG